MSLDTLPLIVYVITMFLGLPSNLLMCYIFFKRARSRLTPNLIYMINLCFADLIFIMILPVKITETFKGHWTFPEFLCPLYNFIHFSTIYASVCFLSAVAIGRYLSAAFPIKYKIYKKPRYSLLVCLVLWVLVFFHVALIFVLETSQNKRLEMFLSIQDDKLVCYNNFTSEQLQLIVVVRLEISIALYFFPLVITAFCYFRCIQILMRSQLHRKHKEKATCVAVTTLTFFIVCFAPYNISHVVGFIKHENVSWRQEALLPSTCNAFLDPLIFYFLSDTGQGFYQVWRSLQQKYSISKRKLSSVFSKELPDQPKSPTVKTISATV